MFLITIYYESKIVSKLFASPEVRSNRAYFGVSVSISKGIFIDFVNAKYRG
jgi:hypothetical protein